MTSKEEKAFIEECSCCHDLFPLALVDYDGRQYLCSECRVDLNKKYEETEERANSFRLLGQGE